MNEREDTQDLSALMAQVEQLGDRLDAAEEKSATILNALKVMHRNEERIYKELDSVQHALASLHRSDAKASRVSFLRRFISKYHIFLIASFLFLISSILTGLLVSTGW